MKQKKKQYCLIECLSDGTEQTLQPKIQHRTL